MGKSRIGARVRVFSGSDGHDRGYGTIVGARDIYVVRAKSLLVGGIEETYSVADGSKLPDDVLADIRASYPDLSVTEELVGDSPEIRLDSGETIRGSECWWEEVPSEIITVRGGI